MSGRDTTNVTDTQYQGYSQDHPDHTDNGSAIGPAGTTSTTGPTGPTGTIGPNDAWERVTNRMRQDIGEAAVSKAFAFKPVQAVLVEVR